MSIGNPKQTLNLIFDTGSGDFWVWSWLMPISLLDGRAYYNGSASTEATSWDGQSWGATYSIGSTYGVVWQDIVWIDNIAIGGNPVECSQNVADWFSSLPGVDGVLGLSNAFNDSERPLAQQTWASYILPQLAGEFPVPQNLCQTTDTSSARIHRISCTQRSRDDRFRSHR